MAMASRAALIRSPAGSSMSSARGGGSGDARSARSISSSVVSPIAEITTTTSWPCALVATMRLATRLMLSASATEEPPYFCTTRPTSTPSAPVHSNGDLPTDLWSSRRGRRILGAVSEPLSPEPESATPATQRSSSEPRIGDADRDRAVGYLQEHLAQGRLDAGEFDERMERALRARTGSELTPLFSDLPQPKPGQELTPAAGFTAPPWQAGQAVTPTPAPASTAAFEREP